MLVCADEAWHCCCQMPGFPKERLMMSEPRPHILIVDDDDEIRAILSEALSASYQCITSSSATGALKTLETETFDLILTDINMPEMSGLEMMPYLTNLAPDSVVGMTS